MSAANLAFGSLAQAFVVLLDITRGDLAGLPPWDTAAADVAHYYGGNGWLPICILALLTVYFLVAFVYMLSVILGMPELKRFAKVEAQQAFASTVLVGLLFATVQVEYSAINPSAGTDLGQELVEVSSGVYMAQNLTEQIAGGIVAPGKEGALVSPFAVAYAQLRTMINCVKDYYADNATTGRWIEWAFGISINFEVVGIPIPIDLRWIILPLWIMLNEATMQANNMIWLGLAVYTQINLLQWIESSMFTIYLPIGIVLRSFPLTRGAGATLMAIAIGLYIVYPLMLTITYVSVKSNLPSKCKAPTQSNTESTAKLCLSDPGSFMEMRSGAMKSGGGVDNSQVSNSARMWMYAFMFPFVNLVVTVALVRSIAGVLGADISEIGRGLFKLI